MHFTEDFLHFIWQFRLFTARKLYCTTGESLEVFNTGILNKNAGPDFSRAEIKIDKVTWVGNVEIHLKSSDWFSHHHQKDEAYDNIILHVVYHNDKPVYRKNGDLIPVLELKGLFSNRLFDNYHKLVTSKNGFPCEKQISSIDGFVINAFLSRLLVERYEQKSFEVYLQLEKNKGNWEETFYYFLAKNFGFKVNAVPFELLANALSSAVLGKHKDQPSQIEALIFGQAGFLAQSLDEEYPRKLQQEYLFLQKKYRLQPIPVSLWKFLRMRPQNFPTLRLAQFAALMVRSSYLFSKIQETSNLQALYQLFETLPIHSYWSTHYHFHKETDKVYTQLGKSSVENIMINTVSVFLVAYGKYTGQSAFVERAFDLLAHLPAEKNSILEKYSKAGIQIPNAFLSQSVLQLNKNYCTQKKCLNCSIGIKILKN